MKLKIKFWTVLCLFAMVGGRIYAQEEDSLARFLKVHEWKVGQTGPLLVVDATHAPMSAEQAMDSLADYNRELTRVGTLSAIVPTEMHVLDTEHLPSPFDMMDGSSKMTFILSTLNADQASLLSSQGISASELSGDAREALLSLLPRPFKVQVCQSASSDDPATSGDTSALGFTVPDEQLGSIKLRVIRKMNLMLYSSASKTGRGTDTESLTRARWLQCEPDGKFRLIKDLPNEPKPSDLDYSSSALSQQVDLPAKTTVLALVKSIGVSTGLELHVEPAFARLPVNLSGQSARAGDVLKAIALSVTGTYRKVGAAYVLCLNLEGFGSRQLALWRWEQSWGPSEHSQKWGTQAQKSGALAAIGYDTSDPLNPDAAIASQLQQSATTGMPVLLARSQLPPALARMADRMEQSIGSDQGESTPKMTYDSVQLYSDIHYEFVLPDGRTVKTNMDGGSGPYTSEFGGVGEPDDFTYIPGPKLPVSTFSKPHPLILRCDGARAVQELANQARSHGFKELWLDTRSEEALKAAVETGLEVSLVIRPWEIRSGDEAEPDADVLGEGGSKFQQVQTEFEATRSNAGLAPQPPLRHLYDLASPFDASLQDRWAALARLAATTGLKRVVVLDSAPYGYEGDRPAVLDNGLSSLSSIAPVGGAGTPEASMDASIVFQTLSFQANPAVEFGYSPAARLAFLRQSETDPVDVRSDFLQTSYDPGYEEFTVFAQQQNEDGSNIPASSFVDSSMNFGQGSPEFVAWKKFRADANRKALKQLMAMLVARGLQVLSDDPDLASPGVVRPWTGEAGSPAAGDVIPLLPVGLREEGAVWFPSDMAEQLQKDSTPLAYDFSWVPLEKLRHELDIWFRALTR